MIDFNKFLTLNNLANKKNCVINNSLYIVELQYWYKIKFSIENESE